MFKEILTGHYLNSNDEIEEEIALAWNAFTFDHVQGVFHNWINHLA
jgi:hypothetical protein